MSALKVVQIQGRMYYVLTEHDARISRADSRKQHETLVPDCLNAMHATSLHWAEKDGRAYAVGLYWLRPGKDAPETS